MAWQTPKTNWKAGDIPSAGDFNRIEENARVLKTELENDYAKQSDLASHKNERASKTAYGHIKVGNGLNVSNGVLSVDIPKVEIVPELTIYVNGSTGNDSNDGLSESTAVKTLQKAADIAAIATALEITIKIAPGTYEGCSMRDGAIASYICFESLNRNNMAIITGIIDINYCHFIEVDHIKFQGERAGVYATGANNVELRYIEANSAIYPINIHDSAHIYIVNSTISAQGTSISVYNSGNLRVQNVNIIGEYGISLYSVGHACITQSVFSGGTIIEAEQGSVVCIEDCDGDSGTAPVLISNASIIFTFNNDLNGATHVTENYGEVKGYY